MTGVRHEFLSPVVDLGDPDVVGPDRWNGPHVGSNDWPDAYIVKSLDQGVTNSATLVNDDEMLTAVLINEIWRFEITVMYTSDTAGDYKWDLACSTGNMTGWHRYVGSDTTANAILVSTGVRSSALTSITDVAAGGTTGVRTVLIDGIFQFSASCNFLYRFAQNTQTSGQTATTKAGSLFKAKKLA
jgi:hypothetical protein